MGVALLLGAYFSFILIFAIGVCWLWPDFVDNSDPPKIRFALHLILAIEMAIEVSIWFGGAVRWWTLAIVLLGNGWGMLDAILRYPVVHDIDSLFGLKQICLVALKLVGYALGFKNIGKHVGWFVLVVLCCVVTMPIMWLTALPIGDVSTYHQKHDVVDEDLMVKLWKLANDPLERKELLLSFRRSGRQAIVRVVKVAPFLGPMALRWDPSLARVLRKAPAV